MNEQTNINTNTDDNADITLDTYCFYDGSRLDTFMTCPRKDYYANVLRIVPQVEPKPLTYGSAIHEFMEVFHANPQDVNAAVHAFINSIVKNERSTIGILNKSEAETIKHLKNIDPNPIELTPESTEIPIDLTNVSDKSDSNYSIENGVGVLLRYADFYKEDNITPYLDEDGKPYLEVEFGVALDRGIFWGRIDGIMRNLDDNKLYLWEIKHCMKPITDMTINRYVHSNQITNYLWAAQTITELPIEGCILNLICMQPYKQPSRVKTAKMFSRIYIKRTQYQLEQRAAEINWLMSYIEVCKTQGIHAFPKNAPNACFAYYRPCPYLQLCSAPSTEMHDDLLMRCYTQNTWRPDFTHTPNPHAELTEIED